MPFQYRPIPPGSEKKLFTWYVHTVQGLHKFVVQHPYLQQPISRLYGAVNGKTV